MVPRQRVISNPVLNCGHFKSKRNRALSSVRLLVPRDARDIRDPHEAAFSFTVFDYIL
jgi:hypothetical protein